MDLREEEEEPKVGAADSLDEYRDDDDDDVDVDDSPIAAPVRGIKARGLENALVFSERKNKFCSST